MKLRVRYSDDIAIIEVSGRININSSKLIETVGVLLDEGNKKIVIDIQEVDFVDYNGLSVLAIAYKSSLNNKAAMKLCGVSLHIMELLRVVKLDEVFEVYADIEEALESFKTKEAARDNKPQALQQHLRRKFTRIDIDIPIKIGRAHV